MGSLPRRVTDPVFEHKHIRYVEWPNTAVARAKQRVEAEAATMLLPQAFVEETEARWVANERSIRENVARRRRSAARDWREVRRWLQSCSEMELEAWHRAWARVPHRSEYAADIVTQIKRGNMPDNHAGNYAGEDEKRG